MTASPRPVPALPARSRRWPRITVGVVVLALVGAAAFYLLSPASEVSGPRPTLAEPDPAPPAGPPLFRDVAAEAGVDFTYRNGEEADLYTILESLGGGVAMLDYDGDGRLDLFFTGGGRLDGKQITGLPGRLYKNLGGWKFRDMTADTGLGGADFYTHGVAVADYDRDGRPDLLVTGYGRLALYHNEGGRRFVDVTRAAGLDDLLWSTSAGFADLSGSGFPDLYVCHYTNWSFANDPVCPGKGGAKRDVCGPSAFKPQPHVLFRNRGDGTFRRAEPNELRADGYGLGVVLADVNSDGRPDVYVANDAFDNFLYVNRGAGRLEEVGRVAGAALDGNGQYNGSMGVDVGDFDGTGRPALWVTNFQGDNHNLYANLGRERFLINVHATGIAALGQSFVGFGTGFLDYDADGWDDLIIANGHVLRHPAGSTLKQLPVLLHNVPRSGRRFFENVSRTGGPYFQTPTVGRGLAVGDLDNDGWPDVVVSHVNRPVAVLRNDPAARPPHRWVGFKLSGRNARDLAGTTVTLDDGTRTLTRFVKGGGSYLSAGDPRVVFGLGPAGVCRRLTVRWPWGETQQWDNLAPDRYWELHEGRADAAEVRPAGP